MGMYAPVTTAHTTRETIAQEIRSGGGLRGPLGLFALNAMGSGPKGTLGERGIVQTGPCPT